ncbi:MAG: InlB B-repeat-containing protein, partial [Propionibacteriaceae bacterium]|nr:InlB B-repeat-containing protein [Propionibacteriaceae bacterium]
GLTTIYVKGHPYVDGSESAYSSGDYDSVDGRYVNTGDTFKVVDTHDYVLVQPGDEIIPVGKNLKGGTGSDKDSYFDFYADDTFGYDDALQYAGACQEPTITLQSVCEYHGYTWTAYSGMEAPLWSVELEPVWGRAVYYTDRTNPDFYAQADSCSKTSYSTKADCEDAGGKWTAKGQLIEKLPPDTIWNCGSPLASPDYDCHTEELSDSTTILSKENEPDWNIDDYAIEGKDYKIRKAEDGYTEPGTESGTMTGQSASGNPTLKAFTFDRYELFLGLKAQGVKDEDTGQLQPAADFQEVLKKAASGGAESAGMDGTDYNTATGIHLSADLQPTETVGKVFDLDNDENTAASAWEELKLTGIWRYRVRYIDRDTNTPTSYNGGTDYVQYPAANPDKITGTDADKDWDDRNYFYWDGEQYQPACGVEKGSPATVGKCPAPGTVTGANADTRGYSSLDYKLPDAPSYDGAYFSYYKVWINGKLLTSGGSYAEDVDDSADAAVLKNTGRFLPGDVIDWETIRSYGGDIEIKAVWDTYEVDFHGFKFSNGQLVGKIVDAQADKPAFYEPAKPNDTTKPAGQYQPDDPDACESYDFSWITDQPSLTCDDDLRTEYAFKGYWVNDFGAVWDFAANPRLTLNPATPAINKACYNDRGQVDEDGDYCEYRLDLWADFNPSLHVVTFHPQGGNIAEADRNCGTVNPPASCSEYVDNGKGVQYVLVAYLEYENCSVEGYKTRQTCEDADGDWDDSLVPKTLYSSMEDAFGAGNADSSDAWPGDPTRTGFTFKGWYLEPTLATKLDPSSYDGNTYSAPNGHLGWDDTELTGGTCSDPSYTTQADCEAATKVWTDTSSCSDPQYSNVSDCETNGKTWTTSGKCSLRTIHDKDACESTPEEWTPTKYLVKRNYNFYAKWQKNKHDLSYDLNTDDPTAEFGGGTDWSLDGGDDHKGSDGSCSDSSYNSKTDCESNGEEWTWDKPTEEGWDEDREYGSYIRTAPNFTLDPESPLAPTREGYDFTGWFLGSDCENAAPVGTATMPDKDVKVYACWAVHVHDLYYHGNAGTDTVTWPSGCSALGTNPPTADTASTPMDGSYAFGKKIADAPGYACVPKREGYTFKGWTLDADGEDEVGNKKMPDADYEVWAQWEKNPEPDPTPEESEEPDGEDPDTKPGTRTVPPEENPSNPQETVSLPEAVDPSEESEPDAEEPDEPSSKDLPFTGSDVTDLLLPASFLGLVGIALAVRRRKK